MVYRRTYARPTPSGFENWNNTITRVIGHQFWLWKRARSDNKITVECANELTELKNLMLDRKVALAGRTLWLGGTEVSRRREASQFNCSHVTLETVHDMVDVLWLLLQGCGVGFTALSGTLNGFTEPINNVEVIRSQRDNKGGLETNTETWNAKTRVWTICIGDSAESWAKAIGKLLAGKHRAKKLVLDFSEIRPAGSRLTGYGWIAQGDTALVRGLEAIVGIMNQKAGQLLSRMDIHDITNWLGTVLSSRRAAQISLMRKGNLESEQFMRAKSGHYWEMDPQRAQSNNSIVFMEPPSRDELLEVFSAMLESGGSEPGIINGLAAQHRAPYFKGVNPCAEILLGNKSFCNLVEVDLAKFDSMSDLHRAVWLIARANYRQTLVNLDDGILQRTWHENNEYLRLCGVSLTGIARRPDLTPYDFKVLRNMAITGAYSMADELIMQRPKNVTTIKPSGTISKVMDTTEGVHYPLGRYIFNNVNFSKFDPVLDILREAGYEVTQNPIEPESMLVKFPVCWDNVRFNQHSDDGKEWHVESAVDQLKRYKMLMQNYVDHNCSITVSYDEEEIPAIVDWLLANWDEYVAVSFLKRLDPSKSAADLGYLYLPQQVVTKAEYDAYVANIKDLDSETICGFDETIDVEDCEGGVCPVR